MTTRMAQRIHAAVVYRHAIGTISCLKAGRHDRRSSGNANPTYNSTRLAYFIDKAHSHIVFVSLLFLYVRDAYEGSSWNPHGHLYARSETGEIALNSFKYGTVHPTSSAIN